MVNEEKYAKALAYIAYRLSKHFETSDNWTCHNDRCVFVNGPRYGLLIYDKNVLPYEALKTTRMRTSNNAHNLFRRFKDLTRKRMKDPDFKPNVLEELVMTPIELLNVIADIELLNEHTDKYMI